jgi:hypothetical protein
LTTTITNAQIVSHYQNCASDTEAEATCPICNLDQTSPELDYEYETALDAF